MADSGRHGAFPVPGSFLKGSGQPCFSDESRLEGCHAWIIPLMLKWHGRFWAARGFPGAGRFLKGSGQPCFSDESRLEGCHALDNSAHAEVAWPIPGGTGLFRFRAVF